MSDKAIRLMAIGLGLLVDMNSNVPGALVEVVINLLLIDGLTNPQQDMNLVALSEGMDALAPGLGTLLSAILALCE